MLQPTDIALLPMTIGLSDQDDVQDSQRNMDMDVRFGQQVAALEQLPLVRIWRSGARFGIGVSRKDVQGDRAENAKNALLQLGIDVVVRQTGGTAVPQGQGVLHVSMILPRTQQAVSTDAYYRILCDPLLEWLATAQLYGVTGELPGSYCDGSYNILVGGKKLVGTAQAWRGGLAGMASRQPGYILAHACLVVDTDLKKSVAAMNTFYRIAGDAYRVQLETATTLKECLASIGRSVGDVVDVKRELVSFYRSYYSNIGCQVVDLMS